MGSGYDAYFGTYVADDATGVVKTTLLAALSPENVGQTFERRIRVEGDALTLELDTRSASGEALHRTLRWRRLA